MLVRNIIKKSAEFLGMHSIIKYLEGEIELTDEIEEDVNTFLLGVNMINNNVASSYIELLGEAEISRINGLISYSTISQYPIIEIKKVVSSSGDSVTFKVMPDGVDVGEYDNVKITFSYFPEEVTLDDEINHYLKVNELTFAIGVVGEYLYIKGAIDDGSVWDKRFKQNMFNLIRPKRNVVIPAQRWE